MDRMGPDYAQIGEDSFPGKRVAVSACHCTLWSPSYSEDESPRVKASSFGSTLISISCVVEVMVRSP